jgi:hypothetical protein
MGIGGEVLRTLHLGEWSRSSRFAPKVEPHVYLGGCCSACGGVACGGNRMPVHNEIITDNLRHTKTVDGTKEQLTVESACWLERITRDSAARPCNADPIESTERERPLRRRCIHWCYWNKLWWCYRCYFSMRIRKNKTKFRGRVFSTPASYSGARRPTILTTVQANAGTVPYITSRTLPSIFIPVH